MIAGKVPSNLKLSFKKRRKRLVKREIKKKAAVEGEGKKWKAVKKGEGIGGET